MSRRKLAMVCSASLVGFTTLALADRPAVLVEYLQPQVVGIPGYLSVDFQYQGWTWLNLPELIRSSQLVVDRKPYAFSGRLPDMPERVWVLGSWRGCLSVEDYVTDLAPGPHRISLKMARSETEDLPIQWQPHKAHQAVGIDQREKQVKAIVAVLEPGLPRQCVEKWFPEKDGGLVGLTTTRYYVEPGIKVEVPYELRGAKNSDRDVINGPIRVYRESRVTD